MHSAYRPTTITILNPHTRDVVDTMSATQSSKAGSPNDFLKGVIGKSVNVRLNSGIDYQGVLSCLDGYMNIALENTTEYVDGVKKNNYGDAFIRGNNGTFSRRLGDSACRIRKLTSGSFTRPTPGLPASIACAVQRLRCCICSRLPANSHVHHRTRKVTTFVRLNLRYGLTRHAHSAPRHSSDGSTPVA